MPTLYATIFQVDTGLVSTSVCEQAIVVFKLGGKFCLQRMRLLRLEGIGKATQT